MESIGLYSRQVKEIKGLWPALSLPREYMTLQLVAELEFSSDPESYANGSLATDRASHVGQGADKVLQKRTSTATMAEKETFGTVLVEEDPLNGMWTGSKIHIRLVAEEP